MKISPKLAFASIIFNVLLLIATVIFASISYNQRQAALLQTEVAEKARHEAERAVEEARAEANKNVIRNQVRRQLSQAQALYMEYEVDRLSEIIDITEARLDSMENIED